mgnify:CR=1 FL=1
MSNYIDVKYLNLISSQLEQFKRKNDNLWNFRCPFCGDSQKDKTKARGYIFQKESNLIYKCHNCNVSTDLSKIVKHINPEMYKQYSLEKFGARNSKRNIEENGIKYKKVDVEKFSKPSLDRDNPLTQLKKISQLGTDHPAKKYVINRKIPPYLHGELFYAPKFYKWVNECVPNKFPNITKDEPRLVIPFIDEKNCLIGFQGRAFGKSKLKYITIMLKEDAPKIYGLHRINMKKPIIVVEGPIDSMFLNNAIAMGGADVARFSPVGGMIYCYDNEPRSQEIVKRIEKKIDEGNSVVIFPNGIKEKDINDMILGGKSRKEIQAIISNNTFKGLSAKAKLSEWRKI